jgi:fused signal recognition particle receptor
LADKEAKAKADEEARLVAEAEALERAKEDAAAAKFQMETEERDRILADNEAKESKESEGKRFENLLREIHMNR